MPALTKVLTAQRSPRGPPGKKGEGTLKGAGAGEGREVAEQ